MTALPDPARQPGDAVRADVLRADSARGGDVAERSEPSYDELRAILRLAPIGIGIVDLEGHTILTNDALRDMLGYSEQEFATQHWESFTHPDDVARNLELFGELTSGRSDRFEMDKRFVAADGSLVWGRLTVSLLRDDDGAPRLAIGMTENITERHHLEEQLREAEETFRLLVEESPGVVYVARLDLDQPWRYISPRLEKLLGVTADQWLARPALWYELMAEEDRPRIEEELDRVTASGSAGPFVLHYRMHHRDGRVWWIRDEFQILREEEHGEPVYRGVFIDITREKELEADLERQATHDPLTGLANRDLFAARVAERLDADVASGVTGRALGHHAVILVDLDDFKTINDSLGHAVAGAASARVSVRSGVPVRSSGAECRGEEPARSTARLNPTRSAAPAMDRATRPRDGHRAT